MERGMCGCGCGWCCQQQHHLSFARLGAYMVGVWGCGRARTCQLGDGGSCPNPQPRPCHRPRPHPHPHPRPHTLALPLALSLGLGLGLTCWATNSAMRLSCAAEAAAAAVLASPACCASHASVSRAISFLRERMYWMSTCRERAPPSSGRWVRGEGEPAHATGDGREGYIEER